MNINKILASISDKTLNKLLLIGVPVVTLVLLFLGIKSAHRDQALEMRQLLSTLTARDVARVAIMPKEAFQPAVNAGLRPTIVTSATAIQALLSAYEQASSYGPGGGRFSGGWGAQVDFHLRTGQIIHSTVYQNDYASLLFIASAGASGPGSPDDCLTSQTAGPLIKRLASPAR